MPRSPRLPPPRGSRRLGKRRRTLAAEVSRLRRERRTTATRRRTSLWASLGGLRETRALTPPALGGRRSTTWSGSVRPLPQQPPRTVTSVCVCVSCLRVFVLTTKCALDDASRERRSVCWLCSRRCVGFLQIVSPVLLPSRPYREGKAHRAPGNFETPREAAEAYDDLVRQLGLTRERSVNFVKNEGEVVRMGSLTKTCVSRGEKKKPKARWEV